MGIWNANNESVGEVGNGHIYIYSRGNTWWIVESYVDVSRVGSVEQKIQKWMAY
jgi:hypothetical protein